MKHLYCIGTIIILLFTAIPIEIVQAVTDVNGIITKDTTWTKAGSPYDFTGPVAVKAGVILTIEPGVIVNFHNYNLLINGTLQARGSSTEKITFNRDSTSVELQIYNLSPSWNENSQSGSIIENAIVNNIWININATSPKINNNTITGHITCRYSSSIISNNDITNSASDAIYLFDAPATVTNNIIHSVENIQVGILVTTSIGIGKAVISDNTVIGGNRGISVVTGAMVSNNIIYGCEMGIALGHSSTVEHNLIFNNNYGLKKTGSGDVVEHNTFVNNTVGVYTYDVATIQHNNIYDNSLYNLQVDEYNEEDIDASSNWWGTTNAATINQLIYDNKDNYNLGTVTYTPVLSEADSEAPQLTDEIMARISSLAPITAPTANPSATATPSENTNPTSTQTPNQTTTLLSFGETVIISLLVVVAVLLVLLVFYLRKRSAK